MDYISDRITVAYDFQPDYLKHHPKTTGMDIILGSVSKQNDILLERLHQCHGFSKIMRDSIMEEEFSLFANDPLYRLLSRFGLVEKNRKLRVVRSILFFLMITWVPVLILSAVQGLALNSDAKKSFIYDFAAYSQFFIAIPFFIIAEGYVEDEIKYGVKHFLASGIIADEALPKIRCKLRQANKIQALIIPAILLYIGGHIGSWIWLWGEITNQKETWHAAIVYINGNAAPIERLSYAGWWDGLIGVPIMVYWHLRWIWKIGVWYWILWEFSRVKLRLHASHPDQFGGLGFLSRLQSHFSILIFTESVVIVGTISYKLIIEKAPFAIFSIAGVIVLYTIIAPLLVLVPLFFFSKQLSKTKRDDLLHYSSLLTYHTLKTENMLINSKENKDMLMIKNTINELSTLKEFFENANQMHTLPFDFANTQRLFISGFGPMLTLIIQSPQLKSAIQALLQ